MTIRCPRCGNEGKTKAAPRPGSTIRCPICQHAFKFEDLQPPPMRDAMFEEPVIETQPFDEFGSAGQRHRITRVGVLSAGKMLGSASAAVMLVFWLLAGFFLLDWIAAAPMGGLVFTTFLKFMVLVPLGCGVSGFIAGCAYAAMYNLMARFVGGLELELSAPAPGMMGSQSATYAVAPHRKPAAHYQYSN